MSFYQEKMKRKFEELRLLWQLSANGIEFFKSQQWRVTNYGILIFAAMIGIAEFISNKEPKYWFSCILLLAPPIVAVFGIYILNKLQNDIEKIRKRLQRIEPQFTDEFRMALRGKLDHQEWEEKNKSIFYLMVVALLFGAFLPTTLLCFILIIKT